MPNIWYEDVTPAETAAAADPECIDEANAAIHSAALLPSVSAAAAEFGTLEEYGSWLLQHHGGLKALKLYLGARFGVHSMSWQQQQQQQQLCQVSRSDQQVAAACPTVACKWWVSKEENPSQRDHSSACWAELSSISSSSRGCASLQCRPPRLITRMCLYTERSSADMMRHISRLSLEVTIVRNDTNPGKTGGQLAKEVIAAAAATVQGLQSLSLATSWFEMSEVCEISDVQLQITDDLLLSLTAAAGGPGSSLTRLTLAGYILPLTVKRQTAAAAGSITPQWHHVLRQLTGLRNLVIMIPHSGFPDQDRHEYLLDLPVECLPAGLESLVGQRLNIVSNAAAAGSSSEHQTQQ